MPGYDEIADIDVINGNMDKIDVQMKKNADSAQQSKYIVSDEYSATNTYAVGDYCIHENALYKCKTAITTGEAFDSSKWVQTTCGTEFGELNSNLDGLGYGENGVKNLFEDEIKWMENITVTRGTKSVSDGKITLTATSDDCYTDHDGSSWKNNGIKTIPCKPNATYTFSWECEGDSEGRIYIFENGSTNNMRDTINKAHKLSITTSADAEYLTVRVGVRNSGTSITYWNLQLEEGDTATQYKPYIPSVKMLADEVNAQNESLEDYGLDNKSNNEWKQGYYDEEFNIVNSNGHICIGTFTCNGGDLVNIKTFNSYKQITVRYDNGSISGDGSIITPHNEIEIIVPSGVTSFGIYVSNNVPITPSDGGNISVYINNEIEKLKNDLDKLNSLPIGSIIQIEAAKDNIETTEQKYGWQYLGTSKIECGESESSAKLLVTNVYRKNN